MFKGKMEEENGIDSVSILLNTNAVELGKLSVCNPNEIANSGSSRKDYQRMLKPLDEKLVKLDI